MDKPLNERLAAPFPQSAISWRAQSVTAAGDKALALAYIDARDVMNRLDEVCGVAGWQCEYPHANGKTVCSIGIKIDGEWIWKADGAGDSDIEAEKGAISDAFKRAAVKWGIGRYLYDIQSPWVPCESYEQGGKKKWKSFTADPWSFVKGVPRDPAAGSPGKTAAARLRNLEFAKLEDALQNVGTTEALHAVWTENSALLAELKKQEPEHYAKLVDLKDKAKIIVAQMEAAEANEGRYQ